MDPRKKRLAIIYIPVMVFVALFALDKILLIKAVRTCCTKYGAADAYRASLHYEFPQRALIRRAQNAGRKIALNFGTSPSFGYYQAPSPKQINSSRYLKPAQRRLLRKWEIFNQAYAGASMLTSFVRVFQWLDQGVRPDLIMVEISPTSFNRKNIWYETELQQGVPVTFMLRHMADMYPGHIRSILNGRMFAVTRFRPGAPDPAARNFETIMGGLRIHAPRRPRGIPVYKGRRPGAESGIDRIRYDFILGSMRKHMFAGYRMEPGFARYLERIAGRARREKIPLLFWFPPVHPDGLNVMKVALESREWKERLRKIEEYGAMFVDFNGKDAVKCDYFLDPVHIDFRCIPEMAARKLMHVRARSRVHFMRGGTRP